MDNDYFTEAKDTSTAAHDYQNIDTKANQGSIKIASSSKVSIHTYVLTDMYTFSH